MAKKTVVKVVQDEEKPVQVEVLAAAIIRLDDSAKKLLASGLNERAIIVLLEAMMPSSGYNGKKVAGRPAIRAVLEGLTGLRKEYCTR